MKSRVYFKEWNDRQVKDKFSDDVKQRLNGIGQDMVRVVKTSFRGPKTGRIYIVGGKEHIASAPGETPAILKSNLINSIDYEMEKGTAGWLMRYGSNMKDAKYPLSLEVGSPPGKGGKGEVKPRPYLRPSLTILKTTVYPKWFGREAP